MLKCLKNVFQFNCFPVIGRLNLLKKLRMCSPKDRCVDYTKRKNTDLSAWEDVNISQDFFRLSLLSFSSH